MCVCVCVCVCEGQLVVVLSVELELGSIDAVIMLKCMLKVRIKMEFSY